MRGKGRLAKLLSVPVLAACGFVIAATVTGGGLFASTPVPTVINGTPSPSPTPAPSPRPTPVPTSPSVTPPPTSPQPTPPPTSAPPNFEGCSQGFWKNHPEAWVGYSPSQKVGSVFTSPVLPSKIANLRLSEALKLRGGGLNALMRQAVAALLNAAHPQVDYPLTAEQVISMVNAAIASENKSTIESLKNTLDQFNNLGARGTC